MDWKPSWPMSQIRARSPPRSSAQRCEFSEGQSRGSFRIGGAGLAPFSPCRPLGELSRRTCGAGGIPAPPRSGARRWGRSARLSGATIPHWCAEDQGRPENQCSGSPEARCKVNSEVRFWCWIKSGGQVRPRTNHTAPQRGAVQGLSGFWTATCAGVTFRLRGSHRGSGSRQTRATSPFQRGSRRGSGPKTQKMLPLLREHKTA